MPNINPYPFPIDIDGHELRIGDLVEYCAQPESYKPVPWKRKFKIHSLHLYETGWWIADRRAFEVDAKDVRICYDPPTVKDVLDEMLNESVDFSNEKDYSSTPAMSKIDNDIFMITKNDQFIIDDESPALPVDKNGISVKIGDLLLLKHNGKRFRVRLMHYCGDGIWHIFGYSDGGGFSLPESTHDITHIYFR